MSKVGDFRETMEAEGTRKKKKARERRQSHATCRWRLELWVRIPEWEHICLRKRKVKHWCSFSKMPWLMVRAFKKFVFSQSI